MKKFGVVLALMLVLALSIPASASFNIHGYWKDEISKPGGSDDWRMDSELYLKLGYNEAPWELFVEYMAKHNIPYVWDFDLWPTTYGVNYGYLKLNQDLFDVYAFYNGHGANSQDPLTLIKYMNDDGTDRIWYKKGAELILHTGLVNGRVGYVKIGSADVVYGQAEKALLPNLTLGAVGSYSVYPDYNKYDDDSAEPDYYGVASVYGTVKVTDNLTVKGQLASSWSRRNAISGDISEAWTTFAIHLPGQWADAQKVLLTGDWTGWAATEAQGAIAMSDDDGDGIWTVTVPVPVSGRAHEYKYVVDGEWIGIKVDWWGHDLSIAVESEGDVALALDRPRAERVFVKGSWDGWNQPVDLADSDGDGVWTGSVHLMPGTYYFKYVAVEGGVERWISYGSDWNPPNFQKTVDQGSVEVAASDLAYLVQAAYSGNGLKATATVKAAGPEFSLPSDVAGVAQLHTVGGNYFDVTLDSSYDLTASTKVTFWGKRSLSFDRKTTYIVEAMPGIEFARPLPDMDYLKAQYRYVIDPGTSTEKDYIYIEGKGYVAPFEVLGKLWYRPVEGDTADELYLEGKARISDISLTLTDQYKWEAEWNKFTATAEAQVPADIMPLLTKDLRAKAVVMRQTNVDGWLFYGELAKKLYFGRDTNLALYYANYYNDDDPQNDDYRIGLRLTCDW